MSEIKIVVIGQTKVGKTSIINQYIYGNFNEYIPSNHKKPEKYHKEITLQNINYNLEIYDITISNELISYIKHFIKSPNIVIMVYDCTNKKSFEQLNLFYNLTLEMNFNTFCIYTIISNKIDLENQKMNLNKEAESFSRKIKGYFYESSAKDNENINKLFDNIITSYFLNYKDVKQKYKILTQNKNNENDIPFIKEGFAVMYYSNGDVYEGNWKNNLKQGYGIMKYSNGNIYEGDWEKDKKNYYGKMSYMNGEKYKGYWKNDLREGTGIFLLNDNNYQSQYKKDISLNYGNIVYSNGDEYIGKWNNNLEKEGKGIIKYKNGDYFEGTFVNDKREGYGKLIYKNGDKYEGLFKNDYKKGYGVLYYKNGDYIYYKGNWSKDNFNNEGILKFKNENLYNGNFYNGKMEGYGKMIYKNGYKYKGEWKDNKRNGCGKFYNKIINFIYEGNWVNDKKNGYGKFTYNNITYTGTFKNNVMEGKGRLINKLEEYDGYFKYGFKNGKGILKDNKGNIYNGEFLNDKKEGIGILTFNNGEKYEGYFKNNLIEGEGIYYFNDKKTFIGTFINNFPIKGKMIYENGEYDGEFNENFIKNGKGKMIYNNNVIYDGDWVNDKKCGKGLLCQIQDYDLIKSKIQIIEEFPKTILDLNLKDNFYYGEFCDDQKDGKGILFNKMFCDDNNNINNLIYVSTFKNGKIKDIPNIYSREQQSNCNIESNNIIEINKVDNNLNKNITKFDGNKRKVKCKKSIIR